MFAICRRGARRAFWLGFEAFGWLYVPVAFLLDEILFRLALEAYKTLFVGSTTTFDAFETGIALGIAVLQLVASLVVATVGGKWARSWYTRYIQPAT